MRQLPHIEALQGSPEWHAARQGHLTASNLAKAAKFLKTGAPSKERTDLMMELVAERMTSLATTHFVTEAMQHGLDFEQEAIQQFENHTGLIVQQAGFVRHMTIPFFGASPDGFIYDPNRDMFAIVEVKCPTSKTFVEWSLQNEVPDQHMHQMLAQMACCGAREGVFVAYDPRVRLGKNLLVRELAASNEQIEEVEELAKTFLRQTEELFNKVVNHGN
jgi:putative phage-type endonuclease